MNSIEIFKRSVRGESVVEGAVTLAFTLVITFFCGATPTQAQTLELMESAEQITFSPALSKRLNQGVKLRASSQQQKPRGAVIKVMDAKDGRVLGSATRVCLPNELNTDSAKSWYLTNAHVVDLSTAINEQSGAPLEIVFMDSSMDLALLKGPDSKAPCLPIAPELSLRMAYDIAAAANHAPQRIDIEAFNIETNSLERRRLETVVASSLTYGFPGREGTGPLVFVDARGLPGMSGGAITSDVDDFGALETMGTSPRIHRQTHEKLIGLIVAVDRSGRAMIALPAPVLYQRLKLYFSAPKRFGTQTSERKVPGGVEYLDSQVIHYRHGRAMFEANSTSFDRYKEYHRSLEALKPGGAPKSNFDSLFEPNPPAPGQTGASKQAPLEQQKKSKSQNPRELMMGTGRTGDGGSESEFAQEAPHSSGLVFKSSPQRRWLSIGNEWSETESLFPSTRLRLKKPKTLSGIYEERRQLFATSANVELPNWLWIPDSVNEFDPSKYDISGDEKIQMAMRGQGLPPCWETVGAVRRADSDIVHGALVILCESGTDVHRSLKLLVVSAIEKNVLVSARIDLQKNCAPSSRPCPLELKGRYFNDRKTPFPLHQRGSWLTWSHSFLESLPESGGQTLRSDGLRRFQDESFGLDLERFGGYRIVLQTKEGTLVIAGPTAEMVSEIQSDLSSKEASAELVSKMKREFQRLDHNGK